jgi:hypothetical protein
MTPNDFSRQEIEKYYGSRTGRALRPNAQGQATTRCLSHEDRNPSLSINLNTGLWKCHAGCGEGTIFDFEMLFSHVEFGEARARVLKEVGRPLPPLVLAVQRRISATYAYLDEQGQLLYEVVRYEPKGFAQRKPDGKGAWIWNVTGVRQVPYRLPDLLKAADVIVVEGEKDADRLAAEGFTATTNSGGAGKWRPEYAEFFRGKRVSVIPDNDDPGRAHAESTARNLHSVAASVKVVHLPGLNPKGDIFDWFNQGHGADELRQLIADAGAYTPNSATAASLLEQILDVWSCEVPPIEWAVDELFPLGCISLVTGAPDVGKTWLAFALGRSVLQSNTFLGRRVSWRKVIYCDHENPLSVVKQRLDELGFKPDPNFHYWAFHCPLSPPELTDAAPYVEIAKSVGLPPVFIFDSLVRFHRAGNENSASDMAAVMAQLRLIANTGAAVIVLHHKGKSEANQYRGSSDIQAGVDISVMLDKVDKHGTLRLTSTKNRLGVPFTITMRLDPQSGGFVVTEDPAKERAEQELELVRAVIEETPGLCQEEIVAKLKGKVPMRRVRENLSRGKGLLWHVRAGLNNRMNFHPGAGETLEFEL